MAAGDPYVWLNPSLYAVIALGAIISHAAAPNVRLAPSQRNRLFAAFLGLGALLILLTVILPGQSEFGGSRVAPAYRAGAVATDSQEELPTLLTSLWRLDANPVLLGIRPTGTSPRSSGPTSSRGMYKVPNDRRVTRLGCLLRRTSIDELPQLVDVLRGDGVTEDAGYISALPERDK